MVSFTLLSDCALSQSGQFPVPRSGHRLLAAGRYVYVIGGYNPVVGDEEFDDSPSTSSQILREVWRYDLFLNRWHLISAKPDVPVEMASHTVCLDQNHILIFGGTGVPFGHSNSNKLYAFNLHNFQWHSLDRAETENPLRPIPSYGQASVLDKKRNLYIVGGTTGFSYNCDVHRINLNEISSSDTTPWQKLEPKNRVLDLERYRHECVYYKNKLILFGGGVSTEAISLDNLDFFDLKSLQWRKIFAEPDGTNGFPGPRRCLGLARWKNQVYLSGGCTSSSTSVYDDIWKYDLRSNQWTKLILALPEPVSFHGFTINDTGCLFLYGGTTKENDRRGRLYKFWLEPPSLKQLCCDTLNIMADKNGVDLAQFLADNKVYV